jgi:hypothetical protein
VGVPRWFPRERAESERFAEAINSGDSGEFGTELALLGDLRTLGASGAPDAETRRRIHADIFERLAPPDEDIPDDNDDLARRRKHPVLAGVLAAAVAALLVLGGLSLLLSKDALPGDALYGVKRAGESAELGLTFGQQAKGEKHLEFATNRLDEIAQLAKEGTGDTGGSAYRTALTDFDSDVSAGVAQLTTLATSNGGLQQLTDLRTWAAAQSTKLDAEQGSIPPAAAQQFSQARTLLDRIAARAAALAARLTCYQITTGLPDELGAVPAEGACDAPVTAATGGEPPATVPPTGTTTTPSDPVTASQTTLPPSGTETSLPTPTLPGAPGGQLPPPVIAAPILPPTSPRLPTSSPRPPLISLPPLLPGLPPIVIG